MVEFINARVETRISQGRAKSQTIRRELALIFERRTHNALSFREILLTLALRGKGTEAWQMEAGAQREKNEK